MWHLEVRGGYGGLPGLRRGSPVAIVNEVALGVGPLGPGPEGLVVRAPDAGPDGDSHPRDAHQAQAVDVGSAGELAGVGVPGDGLQEAVVADSTDVASCRRGMFTTMGVFLDF